MNQQNYQFLCDTLERHGLGHPQVFQALKTKMDLGQEEFEIKGIRASFGKDKMEFSPKFGMGESRGEGEAFYYLNKVKGTLIKETGEALTAEFSLYKQRGCNTREMFNLMEGRPVYKKPKGEDGRWLKVDFKFTDDNGNLRPRSYYDESTKLNLSRELDKLPIKWANPQEKENTMQDLQNGEKVKSSMKQDGKIMEVYIGVSPQLGGVALYNTQMEIIKQTNTHAIEMVPEIDLDQDTKTTQSNVKNLPETTKELMKNINNPDKKTQGQNQKKVG